MTEEMLNKIKEKNERAWRDALPGLMENATKCGYNPYEGKTADEIGQAGAIKLVEIIRYTAALEKLETLREKIESYGIDTSKYKSFQETSEDDRWDLWCLVDDFSKESGD